MAQVTYIGSWDSADITEPGFVGRFVFPRGVPVDVPDELVTGLTLSPEAWTVSAAPTPADPVQPVAEPVAPVEGSA